MRLLGLFEDPDGPCARLRFHGLHPSLDEAGIDVQCAGVPADRGARRGLFREAGRHDVVYLQRRLMNGRDLALLRRESRRLVFDFDDAILYRDRPPHRSRTRRRRFARVMQAADRVIAGNEYLLELARACGAEGDVLPTGFAAPPATTDRSRVGDQLLWIGQAATLRYLTPLLCAFARLAERRPALRVTVVGATLRDPPAIVQAVPWSLAAEAREIATATLGLAPLSDDPFTRGKCGARLLHYLGGGLPAIASPVGVQGVWAQETTGVVAAEGGDWAATIERLLENPEALRGRGEDGRRFAWSRFSPEVLGPKLARLLRTVHGEGA